MSAVSIALTCPLCDEAFTAEHRLTAEARLQEHLVRAHHLSLENAREHSSALSAAHAELPPVGSAWGMGAPPGPIVPRSRPGSMGRVGTTPPVTLDSRPAQTFGEDALTVEQIREALPGLDPEGMTPAAAVDSTTEWITASATGVPRTEVFTHAGEAPRKVAIVGYTFSGRHAPYWDPDWEVWGLNNLHLHVPGDRRFSRWFDLHERAMIEQDAAHVAWLKGGASGIPVYMWEPDPAWPTTVPFPGAELVAQFGRYFTNSISWMIAYAIVEVAHAIPSGEAEIAVYGVDMAQGSEYAAQRPSCEYFLGLAQGMGITITIAEGSDLLKAASLYGMEDGGPMRAKLTERVAELQTRLGQFHQNLAQIDQQRAELIAAINQAQGGLDNTQYLLGVWTQPETHGTPSTERAANDVRSA